MARFIPEFARSVLRHAPGFLSIALCAATAGAEPIAGPYAPGFLDLVSRVHGYCLGQQNSVAQVAREFPDLANAAQRAEVLFTVRTGRLCQTAEETIVAAVGTEAAGRVSDQMLAQLGDMNKQISEADATGFIQELEARSNWVVDPVVLPDLLAVRYSDDPAREFTDGHVARFRSDGDPKLLGLDLSLKVPQSWKEAPGERSHIVRKWIERNGVGPNMMMLMAGDYGQPLGPQDLADFATSNPADYAPEGSTYVEGGPFVVEGYHGVRTRVRSTEQRLDLSVDQITEQYMLPLPSGKIVFLSCSVVLTSGDAGRLQQEFDRIEPLCRQFVNSLVLF